ncbi:MAG TPA: hypothetical protein VGE27_16870 [Gemmatimonas sp.]|uniref:hypothetical protein n=1 Tax=Gemmatimonas sp. TaxID=1962908 RepID=UPI002EDA71F9
MLDELRDALGAFSTRLNPDERRRATHGMREALVHAKLGLKDLAAAVAATEARLQVERTELETVRRRMGYAAEIDDAETVAIAERFAAQHAERVAMLETKLMAQQQELTVTEREYEAMSVELRRLMSGLPAQDPSASPEAAAARELDELFDEGLSSGTDAGRGHTGAPGGGPVRRTRAEKEADAESRLADLKRRMGK